MFPSFLNRIWLALKHGCPSASITREHESLDSFVLYFITADDFTIPYAGSHIILEVISAVWKPSNKSILCLIPEYNGFKIMEQRTVGYMSLCFKELVSFSISVCFFPRAMYDKVLKSVQN
jgi:hypothetical protein